MKPMIFITMLVLALFAVSTIDAQSTSTNWGYGIEGGMALGDNAGSEEVWVPSGRGFFQLGVSSNFLTQLGLTYAPVKANNGEGKGYETQTAMADIRFLFSPVQMRVISPYVFAGVGASKDMKNQNSAFCPVFPFGLGLQARAGKSFSFDVHGGYTLSSDKFDDRKREEGDWNRIVASRYDGLFSAMFGISVNSPLGKKAIKPVVVVEPDLKLIDSDADGLNDYIEISEYKTDPKNADSDGDGLSDGLEVNRYKTDPNKADTDGDGLSDYAEVYTHKTDPLKIDTDGGGMNDGAEVKANKNPLDSKDDAPEIIKPEAPKIDTNKIDTDSDGLSDFEELNKYKTDPKKMDTDNDGLSDGDEVIKFRSDPLKADTDGDGLSDGEEVSIYKTDPTKADTDNDGLSDYAEVKTHRTDPLNIDSDGGGMNDGAEIKAKKNPLDSKDDVDVPKIEKKMVLKGINFETGKAVILPVSEQTLQGVLASLKAYPEVTVLISGHTDNVGNDDYNRDLSIRRAQAVKDWMTNHSINSSRIKVVGKGEAEPIASNDTSDGRAMNRRIEIEATN
jgi:outer membrane protein OmpA-like peptidoglycan-associated protein